MDSVCEYCKAKKVWKGSMAAGRMDCPNGCSAPAYKDDGPNYEQEYVQDLSAKPVGGTARNIDMLNVSSSVKQMLTSLWNMMQPWQTNGLPIGLWRITKDPRVCPQALCATCLRAYDWLQQPQTFKVEFSQCPSCYSAGMNIKQAAKPIKPGTVSGRPGRANPPPAPVPPPAPGTLMKRGIRYDQNRMAFVALCRGCGTEFIVNDVAMYDPDMSYCGRTPRCQP